MNNYTVVWTIDISAESPAAAARAARQMQLDPQSTAAVFDVAPETEVILNPEAGFELIDLSELETGQTLEPQSGLHPWQLEGIKRLRDHITVAVNPEPSATTTADSQIQNHSENTTNNAKHALARGNDNEALTRAWQEIDKPEIRTQADEILDRIQSNGENNARAMIIAIRDQLSISYAAAALIVAEDQWDFDGGPWIGQLEDEKADTETITLSFNQAYGDGKQADFDFWEAYTLQMLEQRVGEEDDEDDES